MSESPSVVGGSPVPPADSPVVGTGVSPDQVEPAPAPAAAVPEENAVARSLIMDDGAGEAPPPATAPEPQSQPQPAAAGAAPAAPLDPQMRASDSVSVVNPYSPPAAAIGAASSPTAAAPPATSSVPEPAAPIVPVQPGPVPPPQEGAQQPPSNGGRDGLGAPAVGDSATDGTSTTAAAPTATTTSVGATTTVTENGGRTPDEKPRKEKKDKKAKKEKKDKKDKHAAQADAAPADAPEEGGRTPDEAALKPKKRKGGKLHKTAAIGRHATGLGKERPPRDTPSDGTSEAKSEHVAGDVFHLPGVPHAAVELGDNRLCVRVLNMGPLSPDANVVHPFVRVWLVDSATGESLSMAPNGEAACAFTHPFDLRDHESVSPAWDEAVSLELVEPLGDAEAATLLFELLDFGPTNIRGEAKPRDIGSGLMPIAWGFLSLRDVYGRSNLERAVSVQLFSAPERRGIFGGIATSVRALFAPAPQSVTKAGWAAPKSADVQRVPPVFRHMLNPTNRSDVYDAGLMVHVSLVDDTFEPSPPPGLHFKDQILMEQLLSVMGRTTAGAGAHKSVIISGSYDPAHGGRRANRAENERRRIARLMQSDFARGTAERCLPPKDQLHTIRCDAKVSAMTFSPDGEVLAAALTSDITATIRLYHVMSPRCDVVGDLKGNVGYIHRVAFAPDGNMLLATSADHTVRVWDTSSLPAHDAAPIHVLGHAGHVYGAIFLQRSIVSGGIDGHLHLWSLDDGALRSRTPNTFNACFRSITTGKDSMIPGRGDRATGGASPGMTSRFAAASSTQSAATTDRAKFWTLDSVGTFSAWAADEYEESTATFNRVSQRTRLQVQGATRLHLEGRTAVLYVPSDAPAFVVVNTRTMTVLGTVGIGSVPHHLRHAVPRLPTALLPDGMTAVFAMSSSSVVAVDLTLGELLTARDGISFTPDKRFPTHMAWSRGRHMAAMSSIDTDGPVGCTINIVGRARAPGEECYVHDPQSTNVLRHLFGGQVTLRTDRARGPLGYGGTSSATQTPRAAAARPRAAPKSNLPETQPMSPLTGDLRHRFHQIISYWRGRASSHGAVVRDTAEGTAAGTAVSMTGGAENDDGAAAARGPQEL